MALSKRAKIFCAVAAVIALIVIICLIVFLTKKSSPHLTYAPSYPQIRYNSSRSDSVRRMTGAIDEFVAAYKQPSTSINKIICSSNTHLLPEQSCRFDINILDRCTSRNAYGYRTMTPCVLLRLENLKDWVPEYYNDPNSLPIDMPESLKNHISFQKRVRSDINVVWVSCQGVQNPDNENMGKLSFYPNYGFEGVYFPTKTDDQDAVPVVAVSFENPIRRVKIQIECRAWARNIPQDHSKANFEFYVE